MGLPFGYQSFVFSANYNLPAFLPTINFIHDGRQVAFSEGWGLSLQAIEVGAPTVQVPLEGQFTARLLQVIRDGFKTLMLMKESCLLNKSLSICSGQGNQEFFALVEFDDTRPGRARFDTRRILPCPDPQNIASCAPLVKQLGAPMAAEILGFIQRSKPDVEGLLQRMSAPSSSSSAVAPAVASGATGPTMQPPPAASSVAAPDLERLSVGALFALADESGAKGDKLGARSALRALIRRFPDHPLAATAARQLAALQ